jgi:hypothetical protein
MKRNCARFDKSEQTQHKISLEIKVGVENSWKTDLCRGFQLKVSALPCSDYLEER